MGIRDHCASLGALDEPDAEATPHFESRNRDDARLSDLVQATEFLIVATRPGGGPQVQHRKNGD